MKDRNQWYFPATERLAVEIETDGQLDPTGIRSIRWVDKDGKKLQSLPIRSGYVSDLVRALTTAAMVLEAKGVRLTAYEAGYENAKEGRPPEFKLQWPEQ